MEIDSHQRMPFPMFSPDLSIHEELACIIVEVNRTTAAGAVVAI